MEKLRSKPLLLVIASIFVLLTAFMAAMLIWTRHDDFSSSIRQAANQAAFPIYSPTQLPEGFTIDEGSVSLTTEVLLFTAKNTQGDTLIFTENPVPKDFDFESFYNKQFVGAQNISSIYGRGQAGILDNVMSGSLVTDSTWIIIKGPENLPAKDMEMIIKGLKPLI